MTQKKKKIAILADFPWSFFTSGAQGRGGGQGATWLTQLAEAFVGVEEFEFHWVVLDRSRWIGTPESRVWCGQTFHRIFGGKTSVDLRLGYIGSSWLLRLALARIEPDLLHVWGTERSYPVVGRWRNLPTILSMQGVLTEYKRIGAFQRDRFWTRIASWEPRFLRAADVITVESRWGMEKVNQAVAGLDLRQVEYGVNPSFYGVKWEPDQANPYTLYSGSIDARKGMDILIDAMSLLPDRNWTLKIAGDGPLRKELEARNVRGVEWLGVLPWDKLQARLAKARCLVLPTQADTSPNVSKEARVVGLPVVTTRHGGQSGYIRNGENGLIVDPLNAQNLVAALDGLMMAPETALAMGKTRHTEDREYFRPEKTAAGFIEIYRELLCEKATG